YQQFSQVFLRQYPIPYLADLVSRLCLRLNIILERENESMISNGGTDNINSRVGSQEQPGLIVGLSAASSSSSSASSSLIGDIFTPLSDAA
ncbi:unnamed protein product, partial [Amoebophrya sp. A25]